MARPKDAKYSETHEWVKISGNIATIGITDFAVEQLNDLTFVDLPDVGDTVEKGASFGEIESVKAVSDLYSHVNGEVVEVNKGVDEDEFKALKQDAFGKGWLIKVKVANPKDADDLMDLATYEKQLASGH
ncbi:MAG: glycine cleavage system protein GcvH [Planctomycetes bacterium]|nr:glycine cleavage system protein GcvH [Planctomycetota bacterium]NUQ33745.1 glycine cleavage system protein GcvH [Planctomycetaceae bacterium]